MSQRLEPASGPRSEAGSPAAGGEQRATRGASLGAPRSEAERSLAQLRRGESGVIAQLSGDDPVTIRLQEMGLLPGVRIEVLGFAPLGDPMAVLVCGSRLAIRRRDAARVQMAEPPAEYVIGQANGGAAGRGA